MATIVRRISKDGQLSFRVQVRRKGARPLSATFAKLSDARKWMQITEAAILEGRHFKTAEAKRHTLAELIERYVEHVLPRKSPMTIYMQTLELAWWKRHLGYVTLADITPAIIVEYRDTLARAEGKRRSNATLNRYMSALSHAFTIAVREWGWLENSPTQHISKLPESRGRVRYLSEDERQRLLQACKVSKNPALHTIVVLALSTGARHMELLSLRWSDIDFQRHIITLHNTKNGERRVLPLAAHALQLIGQLAENRRTDTELVFPRDNGMLPMSIKQAWKYAVKRAGLTDFRYHDLRHSAASYLAMSGATLHEIAEVLGHKTLQMTKRYAHLSEAHTAGVVARMNEKIFGQ